MSRAVRIKLETDFDLDTLVVNTECGEFKVGMSGVAAIPCIIVEDFNAGMNGVNEEKCLTGGLKITNPGSDTLIITAITGYTGTNFTLTSPTDPPLPIRVLPRGGFVMLKTICYKRADVGADDIDVTFANNGSGGANCDWLFGGCTIPWSEGRTMGRSHAWRVQVESPGMQSSA